MDKCTKNSPFLYQIRVRIMRRDNDKGNDECLTKVQSITLRCNSCDLLDFSQVHFNPLWVSAGSTPGSDPLVVMVVFEVKTGVACTSDPTSTFQNENSMVLLYEISRLHRLLLGVFIMHSAF